DLHLAAEQFRRLSLERRTIGVPIDEERRREERAQHQDQQCRQSKQERVQLLCPRPGLGARSHPTNANQRRPALAPATLAHAIVKILQGLRILNGSSAFFMAVMTPTPSPCSAAR